MAEPRKKKVVVVESSGSGSTAAADDTRPAWTPTPEAKKKATTFRIIAGVLWLLAIAGEAVAIFAVLRQSPVNMVLLIVLIVVIGALAIAGSLLWKQANRLDPASKKDKVRFFVQNQLGAIITVIAFLPLIVLILLNKDMSGKQKGLAAGVAVVVLLIAGYIGVETNPASTEQYADETSIIVQLTGEDQVFWTLSGRVFHVCEAVPDVNRESQDGRIYSGTVAAAHEAGKERLVSYWGRQAVQYCGYTQEDVDAVVAQLPDDSDSTPEEDEGAGEDEPTSGPEESGPEESGTEESGPEESGTE